RTIEVLRRKIEENGSIYADIVIARALLIMEAATGTSFVGFAGTDWLNNEPSVP
ncbi:hypothetical protein MMC15_002013, partial [Xylographa vitiligo]|nr:hypothetical protein [Xylographa vitiligo]